MDHERVDVQLLHAENFHNGLHELRRRVLLEPEQQRRLTVHGHAAQGLGVLDGAHQVRVLGHHVRHHKSKNNSRYAAADETLPGLLGAQLDERGLSEEETEHVGHDVIADDHGHRHYEPY